MSVWDISMLFIFMADVLGAVKAPRITLRRTDVAEMNFIVPSNL